MNSKLVFSGDVFLKVENLFNMQFYFVSIHVKLMETVCANDRSNPRLFLGPPSKNVSPQKFIAFTSYIENLPISVRSQMYKFMTICPSSVLF